jgi:DNA-binding NtrC family response regulator
MDLECAVSRMVHFRASEGHVGIHRPIALLVDDAPLSRTAMGRSFRSIGWDTAEASDLQEAIAIATRLPSLVLAMVDLLLPEHDGIEVIGALTREAPRIVSVLISGGLTLDTCRAAYDAGAARVLWRHEFHNAAEIVDALGPPQSLAAIEYRHLHRLIALSHGNRRKAAEHAAISRRGFDYKLEKLGSVLSPALDDGVFAKAQARKV